MQRFDDRSKKAKTDGDDFQDFVWDVLNSGHFEDWFGKRYNRPYVAAGNDGGIDHLSFSKSDKIVFQCKFHGKDRRDEPSSDWSEYSKRLAKNLRQNALLPRGEIARRYLPWFETDYPVKGFVFCTSGDFSPGAQTELRQRIRQFFIELSKEISALKHLLEIDVWVLGWNDFHGAMKAKPPVAFSWFQMYPVGYQPFREIVASKTFRSFLKGDELKFCSRQDFNQETAAFQEDHLSGEHSILSGLLENDKMLGLVLSGPGGVGKTRLAFELGLQAEKDGWLVIQVERNASADGVEKIAKLHTSVANVLIIIDYAEAARSLSEIAYQMEIANRFGGHKFRFIATCRTSALGAVKEAIEDQTYEVVEFSSGISTTYQCWVVEKILAEANLPNADLIKLVCNGLPVLAAFAVYLFKEHPKHFSAQFGQIHVGEDFGKWADKRLKLALAAQGMDHASMGKRLAEIAAALPLSEGEFNKLYRSNTETQRLCDVLMADRWVERNDEGVASAHDIFADAMLGRYLFEMPAVATERAGELLFQATFDGTFERVLIALNRLASHPNFNEIDGFSALKRAYKGDCKSVIAASDLLLKARLPNEKTPIRVLEAFPGVASEVAKRPDCDGLIALLAEATAISKDDSWFDKASLILRPFLDRAVHRTHNSNIVVRRALRLFPQIYRDQAKRWIDREPGRSETHFLLVAWLRSGLPLNDIVSDIERWLRHGGENDPKASFVFAAWLDAAAKSENPISEKSIKIASRFLVRWLQTYSLDERAKYVYLSWLQTSALLRSRISPVASDIITVSLENWLEANSGNANTRYFLELILERNLVQDVASAQKTIDGVSELIIRWFESNVKNEENRFLIELWLKNLQRMNSKMCNKHMNDLKKIIESWINTYGDKEFARFIFQPWLISATNTSQGDCLCQMQFIEPQLLNWIEIYGNDEFARFVYQPWLDAAANTRRENCVSECRKIENQILDWCRQNSKSEDADHVYTSWLKTARQFPARHCQNHIAKISPHYSDWLLVHGGDERADFLYKELLISAAVLDRKGCSEILMAVQPGLLKWLDEYGETVGAGFVYAAWLAAVAKLEKADCAAQLTKVAKPVFSWLRAKKSNPDASFVYRAWLEAAARLNKEACAYQMAGIEAALLEWLDSVGPGIDKGYVIDAWLIASSRIKPQDCADKVAMIQPHVLVWLEKNGEIEEANFVFKSWFLAASNQGQEHCLVNITSVEHSLMKWLDAHCRSEKASFVFRALLGAIERLDGDSLKDHFEKAERYIVEWNRVHGHTRNAGFVLAPWLNVLAKLGPQDRQDHISHVLDSSTDWISTFGSQQSARFVYQAWFSVSAVSNSDDCRKYIQQIESNLEIWLKLYGSENYAGFVFQEWLRALLKLEKQDRLFQLELMSPGLRRWFVRNGASPGAKYVKRAWRRAGGSRW